MTTLIAHNRGEAKSLEARFFLQGRNGYLELRYYHSTFGVDGDKYACVRWRLPESLKFFQRIETVSQLQDEITQPGMAHTFLGEAIPVENWITFAKEVENLFVARMEFGDGTRIVCDFYAWESFVERLEQRSLEVEPNITPLAQHRPEVSDRTDSHRRFQLSKRDPEP